MIKGIGVDIESVGRFKKNKINKNFLDLIFTKNEIAYCQKRKNPEKNFAGKFCVKEAISKASDKQFFMKDIEIINEDSGKPKVHIKGKKNKKIHCSISHSDKYAIAFAIIED